MLKGLLGNLSPDRRRTKQSLPGVAPPRQGRVVMLVNGATDEFGHLELYYGALREAFAEHGLELTRQDAGRPDAGLAAVARDPDVLFFLGFNGWGANLAWHGTDGGRVPFFSHFGKPLLDHFADPPFADEMQHALQFDFPERLVLFTDYSYLAWDSLLGPSRRSRYFLPQFVPGDAPAAPATDYDRRGIDFLLPVSLYDPDHYYRRLLDAAPGAAGEQLFDELAAVLLDDARADPLQWAARLWMQKGQPFDANNAMQRRVLSAAWHYVKNRRRQMILEALSGVPLTILTRGIPYPARLHPRSRLIEARSFGELSALMRDTRVCICPTPHVRGFHERLLMALSRGALALASPNQVCEEYFRDGEELLFFQDHGADLTAKAAYCAEDWPRAAAIAARGKAAERATFTAGLTVQRMLAIFHNYRKR